MNINNKYKNDFIKPEIIEDELPKSDVRINPETGKPSGGYANIGNYVRNISPEQRAENARKGRLASAKKQKYNGSVIKIMNQLFKSGITDNEEVVRILEEKGIEQSEVAAMLYSQMKQGHTNPKSAEFTVKVAGQLPSERVSIATTETQMDENQLRAFFGVFSKNEDEEEE